MARRRGAERAGLDVERGIKEDKSRQSSTSPIFRGFRGRREPIEKRQRQRQRQCQRQRQRQRQGQRQRQRQRRVLKATTRFEVGTAQEVGFNAAKEVDRFTCSRLNSTTTRLLRNQVFPDVVFPLYFCCYFYCIAFIS